MFAAGPTELRALPSLLYYIAMHEIATACSVMSWRSCFWRQDSSRIDVASSMETRKPAPITPGLLAAGAAVGADDALSGTAPTAWQPWPSKYLFSGARDGRVPNCTRGEAAPQGHGRHEDKKDPGNPAHWVTTAHVATILCQPCRVNGARRHTTYRVAMSRAAENSPTRSAGSRVI